MEFDEEELVNSNNLKFTSNQSDLKSVNCFIVTVPTPIDDLKQPNLMPLLAASEMIGNLIKEGDLIIYESTVYPGCIEEVCIPTIEKFSGMKINNNFYCGYSPERINPGDKVHTISKIKKITSGSTEETAVIVDNLYKEIITAGTHIAPSIKVAEAAKVIENTQRDLNIALINELSILFNKMDIDTEEVLNAAGSKWNFLPFKPGLVGGHCIGVDPYYLTFKAKDIGYHPKIILAGREINDNMGLHVVSEFLRKLEKKNIKYQLGKFLIMGLTFKEDCADIRNSGIENVIKKLKDFKCDLDLYDPWANREEIKNIYDLYPIETLNPNTYDGVIISVGHKKFKEMGINSILKLCKDNHIICDLKSIFPKKKN